MHLLLLHGAIGAAAQLQPLAAELGKDFTVHTLDFSGHGKKPFPAKPFSISLFAEDVLNYIDGQGLDNVLLFGYSMGGYVGMFLARYHSERISKLATLATKFSWDPAIAQREIQMINPGKIEEKIPAFARTLEQRHHPKDWKQVLQHTAGLLADLGNDPPLTAEVYREISTPSLLLVGDSDKMVSLEETIAVFRNLAGARLGILPGTPHPIEQVDTMMLAWQLRHFYKS